ncbi:MAG: lipopolysaccharide biosynthesis protein [Geminicoccaceae bacterium]
MSSPSKALTDHLAQAETSGADLGRSTFVNSLWSYLSFALQRGATFAATLVLVRYLSPAEFGLMGYCILAIAFLEVFSRFGLDAALISRSERIDEASDVAFYLGMINGIVFFVLAWLTAPLIADFFDEPGISKLLRVLALSLIIEATSIVHVARLQRDLQFRKKVIPDTARGCLKGIVAVGLAFAGFGVWSLVIGHLAGTLIFSIALWVIVPWRPRRRFDPTLFRDFLHFGGHMWGVDLIGALRTNIDYLLIGRILGTSPLGLYTIAYRFPDLVVNSLNNVVGTVTHPTLVRLRDDPEGMRTYYQSYVGYIAMLTLPAGFGIALVAEPFVRVFYTDAWLEMILPMQCLAVALGVSSIGFAPGVLYKAINRPDILNYVSIIKLPPMILFLWWSTAYGLVGVAIAQIVLAILYITLDSLIVRWVIGFGFRDLMSALWPPVAATAVMVAGTYLLSEAFASMPIIELAVLAFGGAVLYLGALAAFAPSRLAAALAVARGSR